MKELIDDIKSNEMPLPSYLFAHEEAKLSEAQKQKIIHWAQSIRNTMEKKYPIDSLKNSVNQ